MASLRETRPYAWARSLKGRLSHLLRERGLEDTGGVIEPDELGFEDPDFVRYQPSSWRWLRRALAGREIGAGDVFVDLGSGKGRIVLAAARYPFERVIGVEIAEPLNEIARANVAAARERLRCADVELVTADVTEWQFPADVNYVYLFNPVEGESLRRVVDNLAASILEHPRRVTVIYANPTSADVLEAQPTFRRVEVIKNPWRPDIGPTGWVNVYESVADD